MSQEPPFVSVIIPVLNAARTLPHCLEALRAQTYPSDHFEVIIIDNGSSDGSAEIASQYPVTIHHEHRVQNAYVARNTGLAAARGDIIAFTDADCTPEASWITCGVRALARGEIIGGKIIFSLSPHPSPAELYDVLFFLNQEDLIERRGIACTANLFVRRDVFDRCGPFPTASIFCGDSLWTASAKAQSMSLAYDDSVVVSHPSRRLFAVLLKAFRIGSGRGVYTRRGWYPNGTILHRYSPGSIRRLLTKRGWSASTSTVVGIICVAGLALLMGGIGFLRGYFLGELHQTATIHS